MGHLHTFTLPVIVPSKYRPAAGSGWEAWIQLKMPVRVIAVIRDSNSGESMRTVRSAGVFDVANAIEGSQKWIRWRISSEVLVGLQGETATMMQNRERSREHRNVKRIRRDD